MEIQEDVFKVNEDFYLVKVSKDVLPDYLEIYDKESMPLGLMHFVPDPQGFFTKPGYPCIIALPLKEYEIIGKLHEKSPIELLKYAQNLPDYDKHSFIILKVGPYAERVEGLADSSNDVQ